MESIHKDLSSIAPKIELTKKDQIIDRYAHNRGVREVKSTKYFSMYWEAFAWAAILGFYHDKEVPLNGETDAPFKYSVIFNNNSDMFYSLVCFAIAKKGYEIVSDGKELNKTIEQYANGGFEIIYTILQEKGNDYFGDEANFLNEVMDRKKEN